MKGWQRQGALPRPFLRDRVRDDQDSATLSEQSAWSLQAEKGLGNRTLSTVNTGVGGMWPERQQEGSACPARGRPWQSSSWIRTHDPAELNPGWETVVEHCLPQSSGTLSVLLAFKTSHRASTLESKGIFLCLCYPLNRTHEAQRTKGRTPRHLAPEEALHAQTWLERKHLSTPMLHGSPPDLFFWS